MYIERNESSFCRHLIFPFCLLRLTTMYLLLSNEEASGSRLYTPLIKQLRLIPRIFKSIESADNPLLL